MANFIPRQTVQWHLHEPPAIRRATLSLAAMAAIAGVLARLVRIGLLAAAERSAWFSLASFVVGTLVVLALATVHLGNYPVRHWLWRAPAFGLGAGLAEAATSWVLIRLGAEPLGSGYAALTDWGAIAAGALVRDTVVVALFAALLGGTVQVVRQLLLQRDHRAHTAAAIHRGHVQQQHAHEAAASKAPPLP